MFLAYTERFNKGFDDRFKDVNKSKCCGDWDENGILNPARYDDLEKVNERRKKLKLNTLEHQTAHLRAEAKMENENPPKDWFEKQLEFEEWRKKTGWTK